jgi:hypothetical protein
MRLMKIESFPADCVISDVIMPDIELCTLIAAVQDGCAAAVLKTVPFLEL